MNKSVYILAVENSGDHLGAQLAAELKRLKPNLELSGIGGAALAAEGIVSDIDIDGLSILGFTEGLRYYPMILKRVKQSVQAIMAREPQAVVLIDSWGFMIRVAKGLKAAGYQGEIIKYVAPQVWAMREGRSKTLARYVDHLMSIHSFDAPYFTRHGLETHYVGNPIFDTGYRSGNGAALLAELGIEKHSKVLSVFLGSRLSELETLGPIFGHAIVGLKFRYPDLRFISPVSESLAQYIDGAVERNAGLSEIDFMPESRKLDIFAASDVALACSGTVTTQLACAGVPTLVAYRLNALTYFAAKRLYKPDYISIVNIAAKQALMPEFVQEAVTANSLIDMATHYLDNPTERESASARLLSQTSLMQGKGGSASKRAALNVLDIIRA